MHSVKCCLNWCLVIPEIQCWCCPPPLSLSLLFRMARPRWKSWYCTVDTSEIEVGKGPPNIHCAPMSGGTLCNTCYEHVQHQQPVQCWLSWGIGVASKWSLAMLDFLLPAKRQKIFVPLISSRSFELQTHPWLWMWPPCVKWCWRGWVVCGWRGDTHVH